MSKKSSSFLPSYLQTEKNKKFLSSTLDGFLQTPDLQRIDGYVGSKLISNYDSTKDVYIDENTADRANYQLEPALVIKDNQLDIDKVVFYDDVIKQIKVEGGFNDNLDKLFKSKVYTFSPPIDWDKLVNYDQYYWLPKGPDPIFITTSTINNLIGQTSYTMPNSYPVSNGMKLIFSSQLSTGTTVIFSNTEYIVEGVGKSIELVEFSKLEPNLNLCSVTNEAFDNSPFDYFGFDSDGATPIIPDYITINKASKDLNPWSRYNRWFHRSVLTTTAVINNIDLSLDNTFKAKRPIVEFQPNIQLYNFGKIGLKNVDLIDFETQVPSSVNGITGFYIDEVLLESGYKVIFAGDLNQVNRKKVYTVTFSTVTNLINLVEDSSYIIDDRDSIAVNLGRNNQGESFYYKEETFEWIKSQSHNKHNEFPHFDVFDEYDISLNEKFIDNDFSGTKIFGYDVGNGINDVVLGFPISYNQNLIGISSFNFKNYFSTETFNYVENNVSIKSDVDSYFIKIYNTGTYTLKNVYSQGVISNIPIIQNYDITETTSSLLLTSINLPYSTNNITLSAKVNNQTRDVGYTVTTGTFKIDFLEQLQPNDYVSVKIETTQTANTNGYYEVAPSLTNNPFNEKISTITYSQLLDYVGSMIPSIGLFSGDFPGESNLRNFNNINEYGKTLISNECLVSYVQLFLGNTDNSLLESFRWTAEQYNGFKQNFLRYLINYNNVLDPVSAVDTILAEMFKNKLINESFYRSDMVAYGTGKVIKSFTIVNTANIELPLANNFDLSRLSFESILIYKNQVQLIHEIDYIFNYTNATVTIIAELAVNDVIDIHYYSSTLGSFIPPTPTKHGLYFKFVPEIFTDTRYVSGPVKMIRGHDGSLMKAYDDYRDDIILELEKRIYNNLKNDYNKDVFNIYEKLPGGFRQTNFDLNQFNQLLQKDFSTWVTKNNINFTKNTSSDYDDEITWNLINVVDKVRGHTLNGSYRNILKFLYDTDRPHTHPWECLGFTSKPNWWDDRYGTQYNFFNNLLWDEVLSGIIADPNNTRLESTFQRSNAVRPVTPNGTLRQIQDFVYSFDTSLNRQSDWEFGDFGPAETAWRYSSYYPYSLQIALCLTYPIEYLSKLFDISRVEKNIANQIIWKEDKKFLSPKKLLVEGYNVDQISGFGNFLLEYGVFRNKNYRQDFANSIKNLEMNLSYKVGGFTTQDKLQIKINAVDPESTSPGLVLPKEDYIIKLHQSNPTTVLDLSGIIIQKVGTYQYSIRGYNREKLSFTIHNPMFGSSPQTIQVGGKSEKFNEWKPYTPQERVGLNTSDLIAETNVQRFYKQGQIVRYDNKYYRVKVSHNGTEKFNQEYFQRISQLPYIGGAKVLTTNLFEENETVVPYNTVFNSIQEVYNFIIGYQNYLEKQGFVFDYYNNDLGAILDWNYSAKEFLFWSTQNWAAGNLITLSPFADYIKFKKDNYIVDDVFSSRYQYSLQNADGVTFNKENVEVTRDNNDFILRVINTEDGIFFARLTLIQKEHILIFNNTTIFNDTIFDKPTGYRQKRIKLSGFRTRNWNGDLSSPGFLFYKGNYENWTPFKSYNIGDVVSFNTKFYQANVNILGTETFNYDQWSLLNSKYDDALLPNFEYKISQFDDFYSVDIDNFDTEQQRLAQHLIGYTPRNYLSKIIIDPIAQYKFYQGFIKDKGTKKVLSNLVKVNQNRENSSIELLEEWALRVGEYGSYSTYKELEFKLDEGKSLENPYLLALTDKVFDNTKSLIHYTSSTDILLKPNNFDIESAFYTSTGTFDKNLTKLLYAGYVRFDDVTTTAYNKNSILDIANSGLIQNGDTIWLGFLENGDWTVYRYYKQRAKIVGVFVSSPGASLTFATNTHHNLAVGDIISVVGFNNQVNGVYQIIDVPNLVQFTVASTIAGISNEPLLSFGSLFKFERARFTNFVDWANVKDQFNLATGSKVWIDKDENNTWSVYEKIRNYDTAVEYTAGDFPVGQKFGFSIFANSATDVVLVGAPAFHVQDSLNYGRVRYYKQVKNKLQTLFDIELNFRNNYAASTSTDFGYTLDYDIGKGLVIIGAPNATDVRASRSTSTLIAISSSTILPSRANVNEGLVKISSKNFRSNGETTKAVLAQPYVNTATLQHSRYGHSVYVNQVDISTSTMLLVGAPGNAVFTGTGAVFAYKINLLDVDNLDFSLDNFVNTYRGSNSFTDYKNRVLTILPYYVSNNIFVVNGITRYGLYRDPDDAGLAFYTDSSFILGIDGNSETFKNLFFADTAISPGSFDYDRSFTENKLYQKRGTIDIRTFFTNTTQVLSTSSVSLTLGSKWGYAIGGDKDGNNIAISAPNYFANGIKGIVQIFDKNLHWKQTINSPLSNDDEFGTSLKVSSSGKFLFVGSNKSIASLETYGKVVIYTKADSGEYELTQILENPVFNSDLKFGQSIGISENEDILAISSLGTNKSEVVKFFQSVVSKKGETTFDNGQTRFVTVIPNSGSLNVYQNFDGLFVAADELLPDSLEINGKFGQAIAVTNKDIFVGAPSYDFNLSKKDITALYKFAVKDTSKNIWNKLRFQEDLVDVEKIKRVSLIDTKEEKLLEYLDIFDPIKGRIPGIADQELKYKAVADPAVYSVGIAGTVVDTTKNWLDDHVGELWWDLSSAKYSWYEQGNEVYRKNNWGRLFPGSTIDVYEWVRSTLTPSEWAAQADTSAGLTKGISGQPKFPDNSVISVKQVLNTVTGGFENVYFFWVKNKTVVPDKLNRRISALDVSRLIADPTGYGLKHIQFLSDNSIALANVQGLLVDDRTSLNIVYDEINNLIPLHTEWQLVREGDSSSDIPPAIEKKIIDSLVGIDDFGNAVPEIGLTFRNRYGISFRPRQTVFVNRFEAVRNIIDFANEILIENRIYGISSFDNLNSSESVPDESEREYDYLVEDRDILALIDTDTFRQAKVSCSISNGKITNIIVVDPGFGYNAAPKITVTPNLNNETVLQSFIDSQGRVTSVEVVQTADNFNTPPVLEVRPHSVLIQVDEQSNNRWSLNRWDYEDKLWVKTRTQLYNTTLYWEFIDYTSSTFNQFKSFTAVITDLYEITKLTNIQPGDYVNVLNLGNGRRGILEKAQPGKNGDFSEDWNIVFNEKATIKFSDELWNIGLTNYGFDKSPIDETLYDQLPNIELKFILKALKENIFIGDLRINWNLMLFYAIKYAFTEQKYLDWAFKTSFVVVKSKVNNLDNPSAFRLDNSEFYEDFVKEVKPYRTKIRNFVNVSQYTENSNVFSTDFDIPSIYDPEFDFYKGVITQANNIFDPIFNEEPYKTWKDNRLFYVKEVIIADGGSGYGIPPIVQFNGGTYGGASVSNPATAKAYIRNGSVYKVEVTYSGKDYEVPPAISFTGSNFTSPATASVVMANDTTRKKLIGIKFDRYSETPEVINQTVTYTFPDPCDGSTFEFTLPFRADTNKQFIFPTLDKKLVLGDDYTIREESVKDNGLTTTFSKFIFTNYVPKQGQIFKIVYRKHVSLSNAIDRINEFYQPTDTMVGKSLPLLMKGLEYPYTRIQGLKFDYSTPLLESATQPADPSLVPPFPFGWETYTAAQKIEWFNLNNIRPSVLQNNFGVTEDELLYLALNGYKFAEEVLTGTSSPLSSINLGVYSNGGGWNDFTSNYIKTKIVAPATTTSTTLFLSSINGISVGQSINFLNTNSSDLIFRKGTVVTAINTAAKSISISSPTYTLDKVYSSQTAVGSFIKFETQNNFFNDIRAGDNILVSGVATGGYNGYYTVLGGDNAPGNNQFLVTATNILASTGTIVTNGSVRVLSILQPINVQNKVIGNYNFSVGPCLFPQWTLTPRSPSVMEGYNATFTINAEDLSQVEFGAGRTFGYFLSGGNITAADFAPAQLSATISSSIISLPYTFTISVSDDAVSENTETLTVSLFTFETASPGTSPFATVANTSIKLRDRPINPIYGITAYDVNGNQTSLAQEGDTITFVVTGTNIDFGSDGRVFRVVATGTNITTGDLIEAVLTSSNAIRYSEDEDWPIAFQVTINQDFLNEGTEVLYMNLETWLNEIEAGTSTYTVTTPVTILDSAPAEASYQLIADNLVYEGFVSTITLVTTNLTIGQPIVYAISTVSGSVTLADLSTSSYTGTFILMDGGALYPGKQYATQSFNYAVNDTYESNDKFRLSLTNVASSLGLVQGVTYVDVQIQDQIVSNYGQNPSSIVSRTDLRSTAFSQIRIRTTGSFNISIAETNAIFPSGVNITPIPQQWAYNTSSIAYSYYVRAIVDPYDTWLNNAQFTGPGFGSTLDVSYFATNGYSPVTGNWVLISDADSIPVSGNLGWFATASFDDSGASKAAYYLTIQIAATSGGPVIAEGTYNVLVEGQNNSTVAPNIGGRVIERNDEIREK